MPSPRGKGWTCRSQIEPNAARRGDEKKYVFRKVLVTVLFDVVVTPPMGCKPQSGMQSRLEKERIVYFF